MKCPKCQFENLQDVKFCVHCGNKVETICPKCGSSNSPAFNFCGECGYDLSKSTEPASPKTNEHDIQLTESPPEKTIPTSIPAEGERKHITVLFSDLSGYTAMSERLDPEEVKETTSRIFGEISKIVGKYDGFIEKYVGDAVMVLFGVSKAHEDDPIRAVKVAREIHELVDGISPEVESRIGQPISMHTGINTGLVVTGGVDMERGTHGVAGDTINLASRLSNLAKPGEILVGPGTYSQNESYFNFEALGPTKLKGKTESVRIYQVTTPKEQPRKVHRIHGLRAELVGRKVEIAQLKEAADRLRNGKGSIFSICGEAGTGKSRLIEEFKASLDLEKLQWQEGHAYPYAQNIPYFPLINLLSHALQIEEGDTREKVRTKVETSIEILVGKSADVIPYIGSLFALSYPEIEGIGPDSWKYHLQKATQEILSALTLRAPTVICLEDLHWADPSSLEFFRLLLTETRHPVLFLCVYRPIITLFSNHQLAAFSESYQEMTLHDLSPPEMQDMLQSLLKTETFPHGLIKFIQSNIEGNPFYLEEAINSLIESETLIRENKNWVLSKPISESDISPTIHGVISARLDRLGNETKRSLQEASVIGRVFLYKILKRITKLEDNIDVCLNRLQQHDMIRVRSLEPDLEYVFKHALTQEAVYSGLLKKERKEIHERIARVMEKLFHDRLSEFFETLAFHFKQGKSVTKAIEYLVKSGEKSLERYALEESHQYFTQAFELLSDKPQKTEQEQELLIDLINRWAEVFYFRGAYSSLIDLLKKHEDLAAFLDDKKKLGMLYTWLGISLRYRDKLKDAYQYLSKALKIGEEIENEKVIGYASTWLSFTCTDLGLLGDAIVFGERAQKISNLDESDRTLFITCMRAMGWAYSLIGDCKKITKVGRILLDYGQSQSDTRSISWGYVFLGVGHNSAGDFPSSIECLQKAIQVSVDPLVLNMAKVTLGMSYISDGQLQEAEKTLDEVISFSENFGSEFHGAATQGLLSIVSLLKGNLDQGVRIAGDLLKEFYQNNKKYNIIGYHVFLGNVYLQIIQRKRPMNFSLLYKNIGFLVKNILFVNKKAEYHFNKAIEISKNIGAKGYLGQAYLGLGFLHKAKSRIEQAGECFSEALQAFEQCKADFYLKQANEALESLK